MIWYKFHIGDYISHTMHLDDAEDLAYRRLLDWYYMGEKPLPLDTALVARRIRLDEDVVTPVLNEFFEKTEDGYINSRADKEIGAYSVRVELNRRSAKLGGRPKTIVVPKNDPSCNPNRTETEQKQNKESTSSKTTRFAEFWDAWPKSPRKVGKSTCEKKWKVEKLDELADYIIAHVKALKGTEQWTKGFEPSPQTYINQRRWNDGDEPENVFRRGV
jgi:uncharacterized protein YdaU (DUF1376 family)